MIELRDVTVRYRGAAAASVDGLSLRIAKGEFVALVGESGSGKTTTLKCINRLIAPSEGQVLVDGRDVAQLDPVELRRSIGYVFQGVGLFPHMSVAENVALVPRLLRWPRAQVEARVDELLRLVGLDPAGYGARAPRELSGGQRQRVGVARALAGRPGIVLMDEPFGALDPLTRAELQDELARLHASLGLTVVFVTHDIAEALLLADRIAVLQRGRIVACGTPGELVREGQHPYARALIGASQRQGERIAARIEASRA
jgi:osmoprotectant transport system ATP-binding protein